MSQLNRTIYTQSAVILTTGDFGSAQTAFATISGVQSASVSLSSPKQNVNAFGSKGIIDRVQLEPDAATATFSFILPTSTGAGAHLSPTLMNDLMQNSLLDQPTGINVEIPGIGYVYSGILSSVSINAAVGDLATCEMTIEGIPSGGNGLSTDVPAVDTPVVASTYSVVTPDRISGLNGGGTAGFGGCVQTASFSWEVPVERIQCLGHAVSNSTTFTNPPGTSSMSVEGVESPSLNITGLIVGGYKFSLGVNADPVSKEANLAVGDVAATFNISIESTADSCVVSDS